MRFSLIDRSGILSQESRDFAARRFRFAFSRFTPKIERIAVVLSDTNGPRGGTDKSCRVTIKLKQLGTLTVTSVASEPESSLALAADRAGRAVARTIGKHQDVRRRGGLLAN